MDRVIFHVDVNSAFLSWTAVEWLKADPTSVDLRTIPSAVGGDRKTRHGIITAKSIPAKKYGIHTAETVASALSKCPQLVLVRSDFAVYRKYSRALMELLHEYTDLVEQVSIDEAYLDMTAQRQRFAARTPAGTDWRVYAAGCIREQVRTQLGFTVNVGISENKLLAKMASDFEKPDKTHTLFPDEVPEKLWPLPIGELHGCGAATAGKLRGIGLLTIGDTAKADPKVLETLLGEKAGQYIYRSCNGISTSPVHAQREDARSVSNEITLSSDITPDGYPTDMPPVLRRLSEKVAGRLKKGGWYAGTITVSVKTDDFSRHSRQMQLPDPTDSAERILAAAQQLSGELLFGTGKQGDGGLFGRGRTVRLVGVGGSSLDRGEYRQLSLEDFLGAGAMEGETDSPAVPGASDEPPAPSTMAAPDASPLPAASAVDPRKERLAAMLSGLQERYGEKSVMTAAQLEQLREQNGEDKKR